MPVAASIVVIKTIPFLISINFMKWKLKCHANSRRQRQRRRWHEHQISTYIHTPKERERERVEQGHQTVKFVYVCVCVAHWLPKWRAILIPCTKRYEMNKKKMAKAHKRYTLLHNSNWWKKSAQHISHRALSCLASSLARERERTHMRIFHSFSPLSMAAHCHHHHYHNTVLFRAI